MNTHLPNIDFTTMFSEAQMKLNRQFDSIHTLRKHAEIILGASSIIVSLFAALNASITTVKQDYFLYYAFFIGLIILFYGILMCFVLKAVKPESINHAVEPVWDTYIETYFEKGEREILEIQVSAYLNAISHNEDIILYNEILSNKIGILFSIVVILILLASIFPLIP